MGNQSMTYTVDILAKIDNFQNAIKQMQNGLSNIKFADGKEKEFLSQIQTISKEIDGIRKRAAGGLTGGQLTTDLKKLQGLSTEFNRMQKALGKISSKPLQFIDTAEINKIRDIDKAITKFSRDYNNAGKQSKLQESLDGARKKAEETANALKQFKIDNKINFDFKEIQTLEEELKAATQARDKFAEGSPGYKQQEEQIKQITDQLTKMRSESSEGGESIRQSWGKLITAATNAQQKVDELKQRLENLQNLDIAGFAKEIQEKFGIQLDTTDIEKLKQSFEDIKIEKLDQIVPILQQIMNGASGAAGSVDEMASSFRDTYDAAKYVKQVNTEMDQLANRITYFFSAASMVNVFTRSLRNAFNVIKELDKAMTETAVVTEYTVADMWKQLPKYTQTAKELGATTQGAYEVMTLFFQQGLDQQQAFQLGTETMKMARIAGLDYAEATDRMTNALRGFNMELNDVSSQRVNDVYSNLAAKSASNVDELSTAMTKTASIAHAANMEFETTAAFLAQIIETTRESAETAGTALKTVIARFSEVKKLYSEGELTGQDEEGEEIDVNRVSTALRAAGVDLNEYLTGAKGLDEVFIELASKWDSLDLVTQRYIATMAAGSRQQSRFIALMQDYDRQTELVSIAQNSAGASAEQFEKTLDSLEAKLNQLADAWNEFTMHLMDSSFLKGVIDGLTAVIDGINKLIDATGGFGVALTGLATILGARFVASIVTRLAGQLKASFAATGKIAGDAFSSSFGTGLNVVTTKVRIEAKKMRNDLNNALIDSRGKNKGKASIADIYDFNVKNKDLLKTDQFQDVRNALSEVYKDGWDQAFDKAVKNGEITDSDAKLKGNFSELGEKVSDYMALGIEKNKAVDKAIIDQFGEEANNPDVLKAAEKMKNLDPTKFMANEASLQKVGNSFNSVAQGATAAANAVYNAANQLDQMGLHSTAAALRTLGGLLNTFGSIAAVVGMMVKHAGEVAQSGWLPLIIIIGAVVAAIAIFNAIRWNNSIEKKIQDLEGALKGVEQAAKNAKQAYDDALSNKSNYDEIIRTMDSLVKGTDEWVQKLLEANQVILDIIAKNPEMAQYMTTNAETGALEFTDQGWSEYIKELQEFATQSAQGQLGLEANLNLANTEKLRKDFIERNSLLTFTEGGVNAFFDLGQMIIDALENGEKITAQTIRQELASQGLMTEKSDEYLADLITEANSLLQQENATLIKNKALLQQRYEDEFEGDTTLQNAALGMNLQYGYEDLNRQVESIYKDWDTSEDENRRRTAARYGITFSSDDELKQLQEFYVGLYGGTIDDIEEGLKEDKGRLAEAIQAYIGSDSIISGIKKALAKSKISEEVSSAFLGLVNGATLTPKNIKELKDAGVDFKNLTKDTLKDVFEVSGDAGLKQLAHDLGYASSEAWLKHLEEGGQEAIANEEKRDANLNKVFTGRRGASAREEFRDSMSDASFETQNKLIDKLLTTEVTSGSSRVGDIIFDQIDQITEELGEEKGLKFLEQLAALDWSDLSAVENFKDDLEALDIINDNIDELTENIIKFGDATKNVSLDTLVSNVQELNKIDAKIQSGEQGRTFDKDTYEALTKAIPGLSKEFQYDYIADKYVYLGDSMVNLQSAIEANTKAILQERIDSLKDQIKTGEYLKDNYKQSIEYATGGESSDENASFTALTVFKALKAQGSNFEGITGFSADTTEGLAKTYFEDPVKAQEFLGEALTLLGNIATNTEELDSLEKEVATDQAIGEGYQQGFSYGIPTTSNEAITTSEDYASAAEAEAKAIDTAFYALDNYDAKLAQVKKDHKELIGVLGDKEWKALTVDLDRAAQKTKKLTEAFEKNYEILKDINNEGYQDAFKELNTALADYYGSDVFDAGGAFLQENIDDILSYAETKSEETLQKIQQKIAEKKLKLNVEFSGEEAEQQVRNIVNNINGWEAEIKIKGYADVSDFMNKLGGAYSRAQAVAEAIEAINGYQVVATLSGSMLNKIFPNRSANNTPIGNDNLIPNIYAKMPSAIKWTVIKGGQNAGGLDNISAPTSSDGGGGGGGSDTKNWKNPYDKLYNAYEKLNELIRDRTNLEKEYSLILGQSGKTSKDIVSINRQELKNLQKQKKLQQEIVNGKKQQLNDAKNATYEVKEGKVVSFDSAFSSAVKGTDLKNTKLTDYAWYDQKNDVMHIEWDKINKLQGIDASAGQVVEAYVSYLEEISGQLETAEDTLLDINTDIKEKIDEELENRVAFIEKLRDALIAEQQEQIDKLSELNDAINDSNSRIFDSLQQQIDLERQIRDNTKTEEDIAKDEARLAYLRRDTSGANALEIKKLEEGLVEKRQNYGDTLVDQEMQRLQNAADKAQEQRERQIKIMEKQLSYWEEIGYWNKKIESMTDEQAQKIIEKFEGYANKTKEEQAKIRSEVSEIIQKGGNGPNNGKGAPQGGHKNTPENAAAISSKNGDWFTLTYTNAEGKSKTVSVKYDNSKAAWVNKTGSIEVSNDQISSANTDKKTLLTKAKFEDISTTYKKNNNNQNKNNNTNQNNTPAKKEEPKNPYGKVSTAKGYGSKGYIQQGNRGADVEKLQYALNQLGYNCGKVDGIFGPKTYNAVWKFQKDMGLKPDGIVGPNTKKKFAAKGYSTGGLADYTGPAWLHGSKSKPELVLNAKDTENFIQLKDTLADVAKDSNNGLSGGDNYFDIKVDVGEIGSDYDVEKMIAKIKDAIDQDARYRNVNSINFIR